MIQNKNFLTSAWSGKIRCAPLPPVSLVIMTQKLMEKMNMKKLLRIILAFFLVVFFVENSLADGFNFRKTKWGMSIAQVKSSEPLEVMKEDKNLLGYNTTVIGKDVLLLYMFVNNQLVRARYGLAVSHTNKNDYIGDYNDFKEILTKKYGKPKQDETLWKNDLYKDDYSDWGFAISLGHLIYLSSWETQDTGIGNMLMGENHKIFCIVEYTSNNLKEIEKKAKEKKALEAF